MATFHNPAPLAANPVPLIHIRQEPASVPRSSQQHQQQGTISFAGGVNGGQQLVITRNTWEGGQNTGKEKGKKRCAVCVWNYCPNRASCDGAGSRSGCDCHHSRHPGPASKKARISEDAIKAFLLEHGRKSQGERERILKDRYG